MNVWKMTALVSVLALGAVVDGGAVRQAAADPQPAMHKALESLQTARNALEGARHDKGGHRSAAIDATERAIAQVKKGIEYDNTHTGEK